jgi:molybdopterin-guanine dinucleotide biosynthesis protein A
LSDTTNIPLKLPVYIAAGGRSSRFGSDKARALLAGKPLIVHIAEQLKPIATSMIAVADVPDKFADLGIATIPDRTPGQGPLAALQAAMHHADRADAWICLTSCDLPRVRADWISSLLAARRPTDQAVAFRGDFWEPMPAIYHTSLLPQIDNRIRKGELSLFRLLGDCRARAVPLPPAWSTAGHVNTAADLEGLEMQRRPPRENACE